MVQARRASRDYTPPAMALRRQNSISSLRSWLSNRSSQKESQSDPSSPKQVPQMKRAISSVSVASTMSNASVHRKQLSGVRLLVFLNWNVVRPLTIAVIPAVFAVAMKWYEMRNPDTLPDGFFPESEAAYSTLSWILGIVLVFRTGQSYNRFWDGATSMTILKTELFDACGQVTAFAESSDVSRSKKDAFQLTMVRLYSLLHGVSLQQVAESEIENIKIIDPSGLDQEQVRFMRTYDRKVRTDVVMQWICRAVTEGVKSGVLDTPAPLVSRVLEEANAALVALARMRAIADIPFPVPYATMVSLLLVCHTMLTPFFCVAFSNSRIWAGVFTFVPVFSLWSIQFIAKELEQPFGNGVDDLDLAGAQTHMNDCLMSLLHSQTQWSPDLEEIARSPKCISISRARTSPKSVFRLEACRITRSRSVMSSKPSELQGGAFRLDCCRMTHSSLDLGSDANPRRPSIDLSEAPLDEMSPSMDEMSPSGCESDEIRVMSDESLADVDSKLSHNEPVSHLVSSHSTHGSGVKPEDPSGPFHSESFASLWNRKQANEVVNWSPKRRTRSFSKIPEELTDVTKQENQNHQAQVVPKEVDKGDSKKAHVRAQTQVIPKEVSPLSSWEKGEHNELSECGDAPYEQDRKSTNHKTSATDISSNNRADKLDQLLQNNRQCLDVLLAATHHTKTGKVAGPCDQVEVDEELSTGLTDSFERTRLYSKASACTVTSVPSISSESHVSVQLPASLPMPAFCRIAPPGHAQKNDSHDSL